MRSPKDFLRSFKENGLRITPQRRLIIELLVNNSSHPSVDDIYQQAREIMPGISRSTIYNTMNELAIIGGVLNLGDFIEGSARFDANTEPHHHLYCEKCHRIFDIMEGTNAMEIDHESLVGFKIRSSQVTFYGICPECQKNEGNGGGKSS
ncbi:MAG: Fur family transcriptional regulator [Brevefilum sp.]|nr:Fur family transcriptional regulator [Brevefilum sp.]MDW7755925.1 Fur family transcriptional regulator [Brevefilum sp.]